MSEEREQELVNYVKTSTPEHIAEELQNNSDLMHDVKTVCNNARIRLPKAIEELELAMRILGQPHDVGGPIAKAFQAVTLTLEDMKNVQPIPISEKQVVKYMKDYVRGNNLDHMSIQFDRGTKERRQGHLGFYCNKRAHSGYSSHSTDL